MPPTTGTLDYQLGGTSDHAGADDSPIDVVVRDASAEPQSGAYSICYVNGFQTQPDASSDWLRDHPDLLLRDDRGDPVVDPDWPDEYILDPSTREQRRGIIDQVGPAIAGCAASGYDAVEIDNLDTWTRFESIDPDGAGELARAYADLAHESGLAIAQKNAAQIAETAKSELGFDFAIVEECAAWDECGAYTATYGDRVLHIEYPDALAEAGLRFADACDRSDRAPLMILRARDLVPAGEEGYLYRSCE